ncbi:MAG TPA: hypothetical protein VGL73_07330 [Caulobacteraceae bacterium]
MDATAGFAERQKGFLPDLLGLEVNLDDPTHSPWEAGDPGFFLRACARQEPKVDRQGRQARQDEKAKLRPWALLAFLAVKTWVPRSRG